MNTIYQPIAIDRGFGVATFFISKKLFKPQNVQAISEQALALKIFFETDDTYNGIRGFSPKQSKTYEGFIDYQDLDNVLKDIKARKYGDYKNFGDPSWDGKIEALELSDIIVYSTNETDIMRAKISTQCFYHNNDSYTDKNVKFINLVLTTKQNYKYRISISLESLCEALKGLK
jgi:hypothetical protein